MPIKWQPFKELERGPHLPGSFEEDELMPFAPPFHQEGPAIDIYQDKYSQYGDSKANRLRKLFDIEDDDTVAVLIHELLDYWKTNKQLNNSFVIHSDDNLFNAGMSIYNRLLGIQDHILSEDDFLHMSLLMKEPALDESF